MNNRKDEGFTLIELLIVIVILGILATVVVFAVGGITDKGEVSACKADFKTLEVAVEAYYAQEGDYPAAMANLLSNNSTNNSYELLNSTPGYAALDGVSGDLAFAAGDFNSTDLRTDGCDF